MAKKTTLPNFSEDEILSWVKGLYKGIRKFGFIRVSNKIRELSTTSIDNRQEILKERIFEEISSAFGIPVEDIKTSSRRGNVTQAKAMAILLLHRHLPMSQADIATLFSRGQSLVSRRIKNFADGSDKVCSGREFIDFHEKIDQKIIEFKKSWQTK